MMGLRTTDWCTSRSSLPSTRGSTTWWLSSTTRASRKMVTTPPRLSIQPSCFIWWMSSRWRRGDLRLAPEVSSPSFISSFNDLLKHKIAYLLDFCNPLYAHRLLRPTTDTIIRDLHDPRIQSINWLVRRSHESRWSQPRVGICALGPPKEEDVWLWLVQFVMHPPPRLLNSESSPFLSGVMSTDSVRSFPLGIFL